MTEVSIRQSDSSKKAKADKSDQPETALAAAFRKAIARKAMAP
jgi:hypothetical protein